MAHPGWGSAAGRTGKNLDGMDTAASPAASPAARTVGRGRRPVAGPMLAFVAVAHLVVAVVLFGDSYGAMLSEGLVGTLDDGGAGTDRETAFWFGVCGIALLILAGLTWWVERIAPLPSGMVWGLAALGTIGVLIAPTSPFWSFLAIAAIITWRNRH